MDPTFFFLLSQLLVPGLRQQGVSLQNCHKEILAKDSFASHLKSCIFALLMIRSPIFVDFTA